MPSLSMIYDRFLRASGQIDGVLQTCLRFHNEMEIGYACRVGKTQSGGLACSSSNLNRQWDLMNLIPHGCLPGE